VLGKLAASSKAPAELQILVDSLRKIVGEPPRALNRADRRRLSSGRTALKERRFRAVLGGVSQ
jgi:hypothetical protein